LVKARFFWNVTLVWLSALKKKDGESYTPLIAGVSARTAQAFLTPVVKWADPISYLSTCFREFL
jgi:hypothetical protein